MKIGNPVNSVGSPASGETRPRPVQGASAAPPASAGAKVELSALGSSLQEIEAAMANVAVVDVERVAEIKQAISEGRFKVNPGQVAEGLIRSVRQMLGRQVRSA